MAADWTRLLSNPVAADSECMSDSNLVSRAPQKDESREKFTPPFPGVLRGNTAAGGGLPARPRERERERESLDDRRAIALAKRHFAGLFLEESAE
jgi:hypothetical protein